jgi:membrane protease YdiL (CAAX protease family)
VPVLGWFRRALGVFDALDAQAAAERSAPSYDAAAEAGRVRQILVVAAVLLVLGYSYGDKPYFDQTFGRALAGHKVLARYADLIGYVYWTCAKLLGFGLLPLLHLRLLGQPIGDYGLGLRPAKGMLAPQNQNVMPRLRFGRTYLLLMCAILPAVYAVSFTPAFQQSYPFYRQAGRSLFDFLCWEVSYLSTFFAVEFFFRGYLLFGLRRALGSHALFVSMLPYCMIHVLKPAPEALGSIFAGLLLGILALATGSLWCGVLLHVSVALTMDVLASLHGGSLPSVSRFWP